MLSSLKSGTRCALSKTLLLRCCCFVGVRQSELEMKGVNASLNCALTGGAARYSAGDVSAEEPAAARGEQLAQRKTLQPGEVRAQARKHFDFLHSLQPVDVWVMC